MRKSLFKSFFPIVHHINLKALKFKIALDILCDLHLVFYKQYLHTLLLWKCKSNLRSFFTITLYTYFPSKHISEFLHDRQPKPYPILTCLIGLPERLPNHFLLFLRDTYTCI